MRANQDVLLPFSLIFSRLLFKEKGSRLLSCSKNIKLYVTNTQLARPYIFYLNEYHSTFCPLAFSDIHHQLHVSGTNEPLVTQDQ